jgi:hypothetical protein
MHLGDSVNGMARLVIWMAVCPIGWLMWWKCDVMAWVAPRSTPSRLVVDVSLIPPLVPSFLQRRPVLSPWMVLVDCWVLKMWRWWRGSFPDIGPLRWKKFHPCYWYFWEHGCRTVWYNVGGLMLFLHGHGCDGTEVGASTGVVHYFFLSLAIAPSGKFLSCQFSTNQCLLLYSFDTHTYHFIMSSYYIFVIEMSCTFIRVYHRRFTILIISKTTI